MADVHPYTVLRDVRIPHCPEGEHEAQDPCPDCDPKTGLVPAGPGLFKTCPTCNGTREGGPVVGPVRCEHEAAIYVAGQTAHLTEEQARPMIESGEVAPAGAVLVGELRIV